MSTKEGQMVTVEMRRDLAIRAMKAETGAEQRQVEGEILSAISAALEAPPRSPSVSEGMEVDGAALIAAERRRQVEAEGWTPEHDDQHDYWELSKAAAGYLGAPGVEWSGATGVPGGRTPLGWPFRPEEFKPTGDAVRDLVKAGALVAAEIDRLQRVATKGTN